MVGSLTGFQSQPTLAAKRASDTILRLPQSTALERCQVISARALSNLLARRFHDVIRCNYAAAAELPRAIAELESSDADDSIFVGLDLAVSLARVVMDAAIPMLTGTGLELSVLQTSIARVEKLAFDAEATSELALIRRVHAFVTGMADRSLASTFRYRQVPETFTRALLRENMFELWPPQLDAINLGLLDHDAGHFVIGVPTGAGKTLLAEMAIVAALAGQDSGWAIYVTPSRALSNQISGDLRRQLKDSDIRVRTVLAGAETGLTLAGELEMVNQPRTVVVTTPEKLNTYLRNAPEVFASCRLAIFDEVHKIADGERGVLLESLVARMLSEFPDTRLVLMSGVFSNQDQFVEWIGRDRAKLVRSSRRPTRQVRAVAVRYDEVPRSPRRPVGGKVRRRVDFKGGLVLVHEADDLQSAYKVSVTDLFAGYYSEVQIGSRWNDDTGAAHSSRNDHAIQVASALAGTGGTSLVFVGTIPEAERAAVTLASTWPNVLDDPFQGSRQRLADHIAAELGDDHELVGLCRRGIGYHHSRLPPTVLRALEMGLEQGWLRAMFATPTLLDGLNTAAAHVILAGNTRWADSEQRPMPFPEMDFENLAGRAGRPFRESEGLVILVPDSLARANAVTAGRRYLLVNDAALEVRSQLSELDSLLHQSGGDLRALPLTTQSTLLGLAANAIDHEDTVGSFFRQTLWHQQDTSDTSFDYVTSAVVHTIKSASERLGPERVKVAARTSLSLSSAELLWEKLVPLRDTFRDSSALDADSRNRMFSTLLEVVLAIPEAQHGAFHDATISEQHVETVLAWVGGQSYSELLSIGLDSQAISVGGNLRDAVRYCADVSNWLSWAFGAAYLMLSDELGDDLNPYVGILPTLIKYGVPNVESALICMQGVADRATAIKLGEEFRAVGRPTSAQEIALWLESAGEQLDQLLGGTDLRADLLRRQGFWTRPSSAQHIFVRLRATSRLDPGLLLNFREDGPLLAAVDMTGEHVGDCLDVERLRTYSRGNLSSLFGVVVSRTSSGDTMVMVMPSSA